jgi:hypothetical protein
MTKNGDRRASLAMTEDEERQGRMVSDTTVPTFYIFMDHLLIGNRRAVCHPRVLLSGIHKMK